MYNYYNDKMHFGSFPYYNNFMPYRNLEMPFDFSDPYISGYNPMFMMNNPNFPQMPTIQKKLDPKALELNNLIRRLWFEHAFWTKLAISSIVNGSPDVQLVTNRLLRNPEDFANAFVNIYGPTVAEQFKNLFREHLIIAADLVNALKRKDNNSANFLDKKFFKNADDIADLLSRINPYWEKDQMRKMLYDHLNLVKSLATATLNNKYEEIINIFDTYEQQILSMADTFVEGILRQFPNKF